MNRQIHIDVPGADPIVIDLHDNQALTIHIDHNPLRARQGEPVSTLRIDGGRWTEPATGQGDPQGPAYDILEWPQRSLSPTGTVSISFTQADHPATPLAKDERYLEPEKECSFCGKKASAAQRLIEGRLPWALICDACIDECNRLCGSLRRP